MLIVSLILFLMPNVLLFTLFALIIEPRVGKAWTIGWKSCRNCRMFIISWLTQQPQHNLTQHNFSPGWHNGHSSRHSIFSPVMADPRETAMMQQYSLAFQVELIHPYSTKQHESTSRHTCVILSVISVVTQSLCTKHGMREPEHTILANRLPLHTHRWGNYC